MYSWNHETEWKGQCSLLLSRVRLFVTPWFVHGILQARALEWVAISFSRGSSQPRNWTQVSCTAGRFFTDWAMREDWMSQPTGRFHLHKHTFLCSHVEDTRGNNYHRTHHGRDILPRSSWEHKEALVSNKHIRGNTEFPWKMIFLKWHMPKVRHMFLWKVRTWDQMWL